MKQILVVLVVSVVLLRVVGLEWSKAQTPPPSEDTVTEIEVPNIHIKKYGGHVDSKDGTYLKCNMKVEGCSQETAVKLFQQLEIEVLEKRVLLEDGVVPIKGEPPFDSLSIVSRHIRIAWNPKSDTSHQKVVRTTKEIFFKD